MTNDKELKPMRHLQVACSEADEAWLKEFREEVETLAGLIVECVNDNPVTLLSKLHREMLTKQARTVEAMGRRLAGLNLYVDNLGRPLGS